VLLGTYSLGNLLAGLVLKNLLEKTCGPKLYVNSSVAEPLLFITVPVQVTVPVVVPAPYLDNKKH
jgi:hypothetical protein